MTPERWLTVERVFHAASELAGDERAAYLDRVCTGDVELRQEVEALLKEDQAAPVDIGLAIKQEAQELLEDESKAAWVGRRLGPWRITDLVGEGGMGAVYGALRDDGEYELRVAIKVLRFPMASSAEAARFRQERRILAWLEHPHIARLLDGGEIPVPPNGTKSPYIVMEHVEGAPITAYCHEAGLSTQERLKLFLQVLETVGYAHHKLVLHRDLKPENVLVTPDGVVKLLDFGVAKMLEAGSAAASETPTTLVPLTPEYASPEQIRGEHLSAATDVYSLGVMLYELLGERRPYSFRKTDSLEVARVICEVEPPPLGLDGDLDAVVAKAVAKEPAQRYRSVELFAEDIRRYLAGLPLLARKSSAGYRVRKFLRRNRVPVVLAALAIAAAASGLSVSLSEARRAGRRFDQVRQLANTFVFDVYDAIARIPGATKARELVAGKALGYLESLEREAGGDPLFQLELATAYRKMADVQGRTTAANLGDSQAALANYQRAERLLRPVVAARPAMEAAHLELAGVLLEQGRIHAYGGDRAQATSCYHRALEAAGTLERGGLVSGKARQQLAALLMAMSDLQRPAGDAQGALDASERAVKILEVLAAEEPASTEVRHNLAVALSSISRSKAFANDLEAARQARQRSIQLLEELRHRQPQDTNLQRDLMVGYGSLGDILGSPTLPSLGDRAGAERAYRQAAALAESMAAADPNNRRAQADHAIALTRLGSAMAPEESQEALAVYGQALELLRPVAAADPNNINVAMNLAHSFLMMGERKVQAGDLPGAYETLRESRQRCQQILGRKPGQSDTERIFIRALAAEVNLLVRVGRRREALGRAREAVAFAEAQPGRTAFQSGMLRARAYATMAAASSGAAACHWYRTSLERWEEVRLDKAYHVVYERERRQAAEAVSQCE